MRGTALGAVAAVVSVLGPATVPLTHAQLDLSFTAALPRDDGVAEGARLLESRGSAASPPPQRF